MNCEKDCDDAATPIMKGKSRRNITKPPQVYYESCSVTDDQQDQLSTLSHIDTYQTEEVTRHKRENKPWLFDKNRAVNQFLYLTESSFGYKQFQIKNADDFDQPDHESIQQIEQGFVLKEIETSLPLIKKSITKRPEKVKLPVECCGRTFTNHQSYGGHRSKKHPRSSQKYDAKKEAQRNNEPNTRRRDILKKYIHLCQSQV